MSNEELKELELKAEEAWEKATLTNNFLFCKIFSSNLDLCKELVEILLEKEVSHLELVNGEQIFEVDHDSKGIRLDIYLKGSNETIDLEMQTIDTKNLSKRARYYQGLMDVSNLKMGEDYSKLKKSYVIFICPEDIFKKGLPIYSFQNICEEDNKIKLNDEAYKIFFNLTKYDSMRTVEQKGFFNFLANGNTTTEFTSKLNKLVLSAKKNAQWRFSFMAWTLDLDAKYNQGLEEGAANKAIDDAKAFLLEGIPIETIARCIKLPVEEVQKIADEIEK